ncbi:MAG: hypothetical protein ACPIOQ_33675, partial [Promethearchaeia archaeon]
MSSAAPPLDQDSFGVNSFVAAFDINPTNGSISKVRTVVAGLGLAQGGRHAAFPDGPSLKPYAVFPPGCAQQETVTPCNQKAQEGAVTGIKIKAGYRTKNCIPDGTLLGNSSDPSSLFRAKYQTTNSDTTQVTTQIDTDDTTILVQDTTNFIKDGYIKINNEIMLIKSQNSATKLTVDRGQLGTQAATHATSSQARGGNWTIVPSFSFVTVEDRGRGLVFGRVSIGSDDVACRCVGPDASEARDMTPCFQVDVAHGAVFQVQPEAGLQKVSFAHRRWGSMGVEACQQVVGCRADELAPALYGASAMRALSHPSSGGSVLFVANYHDGFHREVNSTVWYIDAITGQPSLLQTIPTAACMDIDTLSVSPIKSQCTHNCTAGGHDGVAGEESAWSGNGSTMRGNTSRSGTGGRRAPQLVAVANYHGPSALYRWSGALPVVAARIDAHGLRHPANGLVVAIGNNKRATIGTFTADSQGLIVSVRLTSDEAFLPGVKLVAEYNHSDVPVPIGG